MWGGSKKKSKKESTKKRSDGESGLGTFADSAYWRILDKDDQATHEPDNARFKSARAPTIWEADAKFVPVKYGFSKYKFDITVFGAVVESTTRIVELEITRAGTQRMRAGRFSDTETGQLVL